ncbi:MAG: zinc ribbon domain-containing protein [Anaerolineales bacterium]|nr:zinc ribbon domain-containing protein [Anaerolineales bacterium]
MPLYEYQCNACHQSFEELVISSRAEEVHCPYCKSTEVNKKISSFATKSTGAGFYSSSASSCAPSGGV